MSQAHQCDRCGALYKGAIGNVAVDYHLVTAIDKDDGAETSQGVTDFELCPACSKKFISFLEDPEAA